MRLSTDFFWSVVKNYQSQPLSAPSREAKKMGKFHSNHQDNAEEKDGVFVESIWMIWILIADLPLQNSWERRITEKSSVYKNHIH